MDLLHYLQLAEQNGSASAPPDDDQQDGTAAHLYHSSFNRLHHVHAAGAWRRSTLHGQGTVHVTSADL